MTKNLKSDNQPTQSIEQAPKKDYYFSISAGLKDNKISIHLSACFDTEDDMAFTRIATKLMNELADVVEEVEYGDTTCNIEYFNNLKPIS